MTQDHDRATTGRGWPDGITALVLDLDGTLHEDEGFLETHLDCLVEVAGEAGARAADDARTILAGEHSVPLGALYDDARDEVRPGGLNAPEEVATWEGEPRPSAPPPEDFVYLGDGWQIARAAIRRAGISRASEAEAFRRVRANMVDPSVDLPGQALARRVADSLPPGTYRVLLSNTPDELAAPLLERLGIGDAFDEVHFGAGKPEGLDKVLDRLLTDYPPERVAVVGDNLRNDIAPARARGCVTIAVDPLGVAGPDDADHVVSSLAELLDSGAC
ncbi:HAD family hydrolase [Egibacter rhizosphaerae]|uniref:HAD family hydrolase n=1 Tax=Egibacter rhizosphaerae TaxID=1670831 RepID=UPI0013F15145|nr:HAD family hydrolase [Egibacter rhizosphaerae]